MNINELKTPLSGIGRAMQSGASMNTNGALKNIRLDDLVENPENDIYADKEDAAVIAKLAQEISKNGNKLTQPMTVCPIGNGKYVIIAGNRRCAALKSLGLTSADCYVVEMDEEQKVLNLVMDNYFHRELKPIMRALGYQRVFDKCIAPHLGGRELDEQTKCMTIAQAFKEITDDSDSKAVDTAIQKVRRYLHLLNLTSAWQQLITDGVVAMAAVERITKLKKEQQDKIYEAVSKYLSDDRYADEDGNVRIPTALVAAEFKKATEPKVVVKREVKTPTLKFTKALSGALKEFKVMRDAKFSVSDMTDDEKRAVIRGKVKLDDLKAMRDSLNELIDLY